MAMAARGAHFTVPQRATSKSSTHLNCFFNRSTQKYFVITDKNTMACSFLAFTFENVQTPENDASAHRGRPASTPQQGVAQPAQCSAQGAPGTPATRPVPRLHCGGIEPAGHSGGFRKHVYQQACISQQAPAQTLAAAEMLGLLGIAHQHGLLPGVHDLPESLEQALIGGKFVEGVPYRPQRGRKCWWSSTARSSCCMASSTAGRALPA